MSYDKGIKGYLKSLIGCDVIKQRRGLGKDCYRACWGYFYRRQAPSNPAIRVANVLPSAVVLEEGDHWHSFVGSAETGSPQSSFVWVDFRISPMDIKENLKRVHGIELP